MRYVSWLALIRRLQRSGKTVGPQLLKQYPYPLAANRCIPSKLTDRMSENAKRVEGPHNSERTDSESDFLLRVRNVSRNTFEDIKVFIFHCLNFPKPWSLIRIRLIPNIWFHRIYISWTKRDKLSWSSIASSLFESCPPLARPFPANPSPRKTR